jgi:hypothetical protein
MSSLQLKASPFKAGMEKAYMFSFLKLLLMMSKIRAAVAPKQWMRDRQPLKQV